MTCVSKVGIGADTPRLWDRRADETPKSYAAFLAYVALGGRRRPDTAGPLAVATPTTRRLADASISRNTRRAYAGALRRLDAWRGAAPVDDASLAVYLGALFEAGRAGVSRHRPGQREGPRNQSLCR